MYRSLSIYIYIYIWRRVLQSEVAMITTINRIAIITTINMIAISTTVYDITGAQIPKAPGAEAREA